MPETRFDDLVAAEPEISPVIVQAARNLLDAASLSSPPPVEMSRGYWPTICIVWEYADGSTIEVEVTATEYECYRSMPEHFAHEALKAVVGLLPSIS